MVSSHVCATCGCALQIRGLCSACAEEATAIHLTLYAGHIREVITAWRSKRHAETDQYIPALEAGMNSLTNEARNHRHVAKTLRRCKG